MQRRTTVQLHKPMTIEKFIEELLTEDIMRLLRSTSQLLRANVPGALSVSRCVHRKSTVDADDVQHHSNMAPEWWNTHGPVRSLHTLNELRVPFIRDGLIATQKSLQQNARTSKPLENVHILEVGCGAGILTEALARLYANIVAIDPGKDVIDVAIEHLASYGGADESLAKRISYRNESIEQHLTENANAQYDAVVVSEVLEHVNEKHAFLESCVDALKPGGSVFITTFNQTFMSWLGGIIVAEHVLNLVPKGTHEWDKFISPLDTQRILDQLGCTTVVVNGFTLEFWRRKWRWTKNQQISYALQAVKN